MCMLFTSYEFIGCMIVLWLLYYLLPKKIQWVLLLLASYGFVALADPRYLIILTVSTASVYLAARQMEASSRQTVQKKAWFILCLFLNVILLVCFKLPTAIRVGWEGTALSGIAIMVPLGLSFYGLQAIGYLLDVYHGGLPAEKNYFRFALYLGFFPHT